MRKYAIAILSVLMMLGCVCLSACGSSVNLTCDVDTLEIYTNDENKPNYLSADVTFKLENASSGATVSVTSGGSLISTTDPTLKSNGEYSFTVSTIGSSSGTATVKITSLDDSSKTHEISVQVNTMVESVSAKTEDDARTSRYVVKGAEGSAKGTSLNDETFLDFSPVTANVSNVSWSIENPSSSTYTLSEDGSTLEITTNGTKVAQILNGNLYVYSNFSLSSITLVATCNNDSSVSTKIEFAVISDSSITTLTATGTEGENELIVGSNAQLSNVSFDVKLNESAQTSEKTVTGKLVVATDYDVSFALVAYGVSSSKLISLGETESAKFLIESKTTKSESGSTSYVTFDFTLSAENFYSEGSAQYVIYFEVQYDDYAYSVSTQPNQDFGEDGVSITLNSAYKVTRIDLSHTEDGTDSLINGETIDVYSSYTTTTGYLISAVLQPTDVDLDNSTFFIKIDTTETGSAVMSYIKFMQNGKYLSFTESSGVYTSGNLSNGSKIYVIASDSIPNSVFSNLQVDFVANSDQNVQTTVYFNLYSITSEGTLTSKLLVDGQESDSTESYISSSTSGNSETIQMRVYGLTSASGLSISALDNSHFAFSSISEVESGTGTDNVSYVDISFVVKISGSKFEDEISFSLSHVTGKISETYTIIAFVPLTSASVINASSNSSGVYSNVTESQDYVLSGGTLVEGTASDTTLTTLYVEAGTALSLTMTYQTLEEDGLSFQFYGDDDKKYATVADFANDFSSASGSLTDSFSTYLSITSSRLTIANNAFRGFVVVYFKGYDSSHKSLTVVRIFEVISFFGVDYLSSNVKAKQLYTLETLSEKEAENASVSVTISLRLDSVTPTHLALSYFTFSSAYGYDEDGEFMVTSSGVYYNDYYQLSAISLGSTLSFKITALSTNGLGTLTDRLIITYTDADYGITRSTSISLTISDVIRLESVTWTNETEDGEIYLNLTSTDTSEKSATILTAVSPSDASNTGLTYVYTVSSGSKSTLQISQISQQNFSLSIASGALNGSVGILYILPQDMVKVVDGVSKVVYYTFEDTDEDGEWDSDETLKARYIDVDDFGTIYSYMTSTTLVSYTDEDDPSSNQFYANFFVNLDGEQIFYEDLLLAIKVTIADGKSEDTAIRVYNATQFKAIDTSKFYQIMNDITLSDWTSWTSFTGMLFGNSSDVTITLTGEELTAKLDVPTDGADGAGTIKNLTFVGEVEASTSDYAGFVVGTNNGTISGVTIDVYTTDEGTTPTTLTSSANAVGGIAGANNGTISDCYVLGMSIVATNSDYTGGIVGRNIGVVSGCGVEFYNFSTTTGSYESNSIKGGTNVGAILGYMASTATLTESYAYAHVLANDTYNAYSNVISGTNVGLFAGYVVAGASASKCFAFLGGLTKLNGASNIANGTLILYNSYYSYYSASAYLTVVYNASGTDNTFSDVDADTSEANLSSSVWAQSGDTDFDSNVNFGYVHLLDVCQTLSVDVSSLSLNDVTSENGNYTKLLSVEYDNEGETETMGVLFLYRTTTTPTASAEVAALSNLNTVSIVDMVSLSGEALTSRQARSLVLSSEISAVSVSANSLSVSALSSSTFTITVRSKVDLSSYEEFSFIILENMPKLSATSSSESVSDGEKFRLQSGSNQTITFSLNNTIYLNGNAYLSSSSSYEIEKGTVQNENADTETYITAEISGVNLYVYGVKAHGNDSSYSDVNTHLTLKSSAGVTNTDIISKINTSEKVDLRFSVYDGATSLETNVSSASFKPSQSLFITTKLISDLETDNLVISLSYDGVTISADETDETNSATFQVDENLTLEVTWTKISVVDKTATYRVVVKVADDSRSLLSQEYEKLILTISAKSKSSCSKDVAITLTTEQVDDIKVYTYSISNEIIRNSTWYYTMSNTTVNTLSPSSHAILAVMVTPAYAQMDYFEITYSSSISGALLLTRLTENSLYGYCATTTNVTRLSNGVRVKISSSDRSGDGVFYFRLYVLSTFNTDEDIDLTVTFYSGDNSQYVTHSLKVDYLSSASVLVNGETSVLLAKGGTAEITVTVDLDQTATISITNAMSGINIINLTSTTTNTSRIYTATLKADSDATVATGDTGVFYVTATVSRKLNGVTETKTNLAYVYLVDFALATDGVKLSTDTTATYNGTTYDALYLYVNGQSYLSFDYTFTTDETSATASARDSFISDGYYRDDAAGYYLNYTYDSFYNEYSALTLKQQLSYADSESSSSPVYNSTTGQIVQRSDYFTIAEGSSTNIMKLTGKTTGTKLMKLTTTIIFNGVTYEYSYYFLIVVEVYTDEENPIEITTAKEFVGMLDGDYGTAGDFILMNDIDLDDYTPESTTNISSFDGNGYVIHLNSFADQSSSSSVSYALFDTVESGTTLKNVKVNVFEGGQITIDYSIQKTSYIAGFAITNSGTIYNCEVVSYREQDSSISYSSGNGLVVEYVNGAKTDAVTFNDASLSGVTTKVAGFVITNSSSGTITNSRVGGVEFEHVGLSGNNYYLYTEDLDVFTITGQNNVSGFVETNNGSISSSFVRNVQINNMAQSKTSLTAGFVSTNTGTIQTSYIEGAFSATATGTDKYMATDSSISAFGIIGGFVYSNSGTVKNAYANIKLEYVSENGVEGSPTYVAGFVYRNETNGTVSTCYTACVIDNTNASQMYFSGIAIVSNSSSSESGTTNLNYGTITDSYFLVMETGYNSLQTSITTGVTSLLPSDIESADEYIYGFSFASDEGASDGIWQMTENGISLASANDIAISNRTSSITNGNVSYLYNTTIIDAQTNRAVNLSLGSDRNPIIIRTADEFAKATGNASGTAISSYAQYYTSEKVSGKYRLVTDIDMSELTEGLTITTTSKTLTGTLDGNGFTISNIAIGSTDSVDAYGLFAKLNGAVIMNINLDVESVRSGSAIAVGTLAGIAIDSRLVGISVSVDSSGFSSSASDGNVDQTPILGSNVVGGIVGVLYGNSYMSDVEVTNVAVASSYYNQIKTITYNASYIANFLANASYTAALSVLSYAGSLVGLVYNTSSLGIAKYSDDLTMADYSIISVKVSGTVYVYGEVVGGLFGYVGNQTYIYDASLTIDSTDTENNPSYIVSKNLYAGGLIGENYGALFGVYAEYDDVTQSAIEDGEISYYSGTSSATRGQTDIFSHKIDNSSDMPLFIGGLVGYMGGGYIYVGYSKLNVISSSDEVVIEANGGKITKTTVAVGGIVGLAEYNSSSSFALDFAKTSQNVNMLFMEVYASGDAYNATGVSGGIIGQIGYTSGASSAPVIAMKNVMAMNYYSYSGSTLSEDSSVTVERGTSDSTYLTYMTTHFSLVGASDTSQEVKKFIVLSEDDDVNDIVAGKEWESSSTSYNTTVGGYNSVTFGGQTVYLRMFGFDSYFESWTIDTSTNTVNYGDGLITSELYLDAEEGLQYSLLLAKNISTLSSKMLAYVQYENYFLENGWSSSFWSHTQNDLFPHIELVKDELDYVYWDATVASTIEVINKVADDPTVKIIVRGRTLNNEYASTYADINVLALVTAAAATDDDESETALNNLTSYGYLFNNFQGTIISYGQLNESDLYKVSKDTKSLYVTDDKDYGCSDNITVEGNDTVGGTEDDFPGLILTTSLINSFSDGEIDGLNIYFCTSDEVDTTSAISYKTTAKSDTVDYTLIKSSVTEAEFVNLNLYLNHNVEISAYTKDNYDYAGLIAPYAESASVMQIAIIARDYDGSYSTAASISYSGTEQADYDGSFGVLFGTDIQTSDSETLILNDFTVTGSLTLVVGNSDSYTDSYTNLNVGAIAGSVNKSGTATQKITAYVGSIENLTINVNAEADILNVGGYVGLMENLDLIRASDNSGTSGVTIGLWQSVKNTLNAGLIFGQVTNGTASANVSIVARGSIWKKSGTINNAYIGGVAGVSDGITKLSGATIRLNVGSAADTGTDFTTNTTNYSTLKNFETSGNFYVGGLFGVLSGGMSGGTDNPAISGSVGIYGTVEVSTSGTIAVGGLIGYDTCSVGITATVNNSQNVAVAGSGSAYVGGLVGWVDNSTDVNVGNSITINNTSTSSISSVTGTTLANVDILYYGGAIGYVQSYATTVTVNNFSHGGALKVYGSNSNSNSNWNDSTGDNKIYAGGVIGKAEADSYYTLDTSSLCQNTISNCLTYGDVFVVYSGVSNLPAFYYFGGIMADGVNYNIYSCVSLMSNFNTGYVKTTTGSMTGGGSTSSGYYVGAITGGNDANLYGTQVLPIDSTLDAEPNYYSSGVNFTYQEGIKVYDDNGAVTNVDIAYGDLSEGFTYNGYFPNLYDTTAEYSAAYEYYQDNYKDKNILDSEFLPIISKAGSQTTGSKLSPVKVKTVKGLFDTTSPNDLNEVSGNTNGIVWYAALNELESYTTADDTANDDRTSLFFDDMSSMVLVGNGMTYTISGEFEISATYGGGVSNTMGASDGTTEYTFQAISGLVIEYAESASIEVNGSSATYYGGVTGEMKNGSLIFGVSVSGEVSVGAEDALKLSGMVGYMYGGLLTDSYIEANISFRATSDGTVSSVAYVANASTPVMIKSTYASGLITDYVGVQLYTFSESETTGLVLMDCYTVIQTTFIDTSDGETKYKTNSDVFIKDDNCTKIGSSVTNSPSSVSYSYGSLFSANNFAADPYASATTIHSWDYSPFTNYGYATHPIGWLRNVTVYDQTTTSETESVINEYEYTQVTFEEALSDFLETDASIYVAGVFDAQKFAEMVASGAAGTISSSKYVKYVLEYDLDMSSFSGYFTTYSIGYGTSLGESGYEFYLDGNNRTLDFGSLSSAKTLFGTITGTIENLRISEITVGSVTAGAECCGTLAEKVVGTISNITVTGNLTSTATDAVGGVIGTLEGSAIGIESLVNVTTGSAYIVGGVVGSMSGSESKISYSSNSGQIISTAKVTNNNKSVRVYKIEWTTSNHESVKSSDINDWKYLAVSANAIAGGVVGYVDGGSTIDHSYNANSVLANYTNSATDANSIAGGIVGYAEGSDIKITNCVNVGLVGAGNYYTAAEESTGYSVAGGIFGYGLNLAESSVSDCTNDGAVQAIGETGNVRGTDWKIEANSPYYDETDGSASAETEFKASTYSYSIGGAEDADMTDEFRANMTYYAYKVGTLYIDYTLTYNLDDYRHVYAFGIGYYCSEKDAVATSCSTSTDNVENDGNIGEYCVTQTMEFDRQAALDNEDGTLDYWGMFNLNNQDSYEISGYDSYGFPVRIYNTDTMSRVYMYVDSTNYKTNESGVVECASVPDLSRINVVFGGSSASCLGIRRISYIDGKFTTGDNWLYSFNANWYYPFINDIYDAYVEAYRNEGQRDFVMYTGVYDCESATSKGQTTITTGSNTVGMNYPYETSLINPFTGLQAIDSSVLYRSTLQLKYSSNIDSDYSVSFDDFLMENKVTYYSSVNFAEGISGSSTTVYGYDALLATGAGSGLEAYNVAKATDDATKEDSTISTTADNAIEAIDAELENSTATKYIKIAGESAAIVYSESGLKGAIAPYQYTVTVALGTSWDSTNDTLSNLEVKNTGDTNVVVASSLVRQDGGGYVYQNAGDSNYYVDVKVYCSYEVSDGEFDVSIQKTSANEVILGNNNVEYDSSSGTLKVIFEDNMTSGSDLIDELLYTKAHTYMLGSILSEVISSATITLNETEVELFSYDFSTTDTDGDGTVFELDSAVYDVQGNTIYIKDSDGNTILVISKSEGQIYLLCNSSNSGSTAVTKLMNAAGVSTYANLAAALNGATFSIETTTASSIGVQADITLTTAYLEDVTAEITLSTVSEKISDDNNSNDVVASITGSEITSRIALNGNDLDFTDLISHIGSYFSFGIDKEFGIIYDGSGYNMVENTAASGESASWETVTSWIVEYGDNYIVLSGDGSSISIKYYVEQTSYTEGTTYYTYSAADGFEEDSSVDDNTDFESATYYAEGTAENGLTALKTYLENSVILYYSRSQAVTSTSTDSDSATVAGTETVLFTVSRSIETTTEITVTNDEGGSSYFGLKFYVTITTQVTGIEITFNQNFTYSTWTDDSTMEEEDGYVLVGETYEYSSIPSATELTITFKEVVVTYQTVDSGFDLSAVEYGTSGTDLTFYDASGTEFTYTISTGEGVDDLVDIEDNLPNSTVSGLEDTAYVSTKNYTYDNDGNVTGYYELRQYFDDGNTIILIYVETTEDESSSTFEAKITLTVNGTNTYYYCSTKTVTTTDGYTTSGVNWSNSNPEGVSLSTSLFEFYVLYFDTDNIILSQDISGKEIYTDSEGTVKGVSTKKGIKESGYYAGVKVAQNTYGTQDVELYYSTEYSSTYSSSNSFKYKVDDGYWEGLVTSVTESRYGKYTYQIKEYSTVSVSKEGTLEVSYSRDPVTIVILGDDIHSSITFDDNGVLVIGNGMFIKYTSEVSGTKSSMFGDNTKSIKDLCLVAIVSLRDSGDANSAAVEVSSVSTGKYLSVTVYGTIRNVKATASATVYAISTSEEVNFTGKSASYLTIVGLDAQSKDDSSSSVTVTLADIATSVGTSTSYTFTTHSILIAGDAGDGTYGKLNEGTLTAQNGGSGGDGGNIVMIESDSQSGTTSYSLKTVAYARAGKSGIGGFGGDGLNGFEIAEKVTKNEYNHYSGGTGGKAGSAGADGTATYSGGSEYSAATDNGELCNITSSGISVSVYSGNGGMDRLWRVRWTGVENYHYLFNIIPADEDDPLDDYAKVSENSTFTSLSIGNIYASFSVDGNIKWRTRYGKANKSNISYATVFAGITANSLVSTSDTTYFDLVDGYNYRHAKKSHGNTYVIQSLQIWGWYSCFYTDSGEQNFDSLIYVGGDRNTEGVVVYDGSNWNDFVESGYILTYFNNRVAIMLSGSDSEGNKYFIVNDSISSVNVVIKAADDSGWWGKTANYMRTILWPSGYSQGSFEAATCDGTTYNEDGSYVVRTYDQSGKLVEEEYWDVGSSNNIYYSMGISYSYYDDGSVKLIVRSSYDEDGNYLGTTRTSYSEGEYNIT